VPFRSLCCVLAGVALLAAPAAAQEVSQERLKLMTGDFGAVSAAAPENLVRPNALFDYGLAAFALGDFQQAAGSFVRVAQSADAPDLAVKAAVAASLALSKSGDRENTCQYTEVVQSLVQDMPLIWRGWVEETRRLNNCG